MEAILDVSGSIQVTEIEDYKKLQATYEDARIKLESFEKKLKCDTTKRSVGMPHDELNRILELREEKFQKELKQFDSKVRKDTEDEMRTKSNLEMWKSKIKRH